MTFFFKNFYLFYLIKTLFFDFILFQTIAHIYKQFNRIQVMIPLSLYVTIELCKILQVYHIHNNIELFDMQTNKRTECRAMNITEELGQVNICFSHILLYILYSITPIIRTNKKVH